MRMRKLFKGVENTNLMLYNSIKSRKLKTMTGTSKK